MIKLENVNYHKDQHEPKFPLFYTDREGKGLWMAIKLTHKDDEKKVLVLCLIDRQGNEIGGNSVSYNKYDEFKERFFNREILEKDVLIQY